MGPRRRCAAARRRRAGSTGQPHRTSDCARWEARARAGAFAPGCPGGSESGLRASDCAVRTYARCTGRASQPGLIMVNRASVQLQLVRIPNLNEIHAPGPSDVGLLPLGLDKRRGRSPGLDTSTIGARFQHQTLWLVVAFSWLRAARGRMPSWTRFESTSSWEVPSNEVGIAKKSTTSARTRRPAARRTSHSPQYFSASASPARRRRKRSQHRPTRRWYFIMDL